MERRPLRSIALTLLAAATAVIGCSGSEDRSSQTARLNQEVEDGKFAFTVTRVELGTPKVGNRTAQGVFVVVDFTVKNIGSEERTVHCQNQRLRAFSGKTYDYAVNVGDGEDLINIKPGKRVDFACAFDVPNGTLTAAIEVHDYAFSRGVTVKVLAP